MADCVPAALCLQPLLCCIGGACSLFRGVVEVESIVSMCLICFISMCLIELIVYFGVFCRKYGSNLRQQTEQTQSRLLVMNMVLYAICTVAFAVKLFFTVCMWPSAPLPLEVSFSSFKILF